MANVEVGYISKISSKFIFQPKKVWFVGFYQKMAGNIRKKIIIENQCINRKCGKISQLALKKSGRCFVYLFF